MTSPLVAASTYTHRAVPDARWEDLPPFLTTEFGKVESALRFATSFVGTVFNALDYGLDPRGTGAQQDAVNRMLVDMSAGDVAYIPPSTSTNGYRLTDWIVLPKSGLTIVGGGWGSRFTQVTADVGVFFAEDLDRLAVANLHCYGPGIWSASWTGNEGHDERGIYFTNCTNVEVDRVWVRNFGGAGVALRGGCSGVVRNAFVEGTHLLGTALSASDNFQNGIYVTYGPASEAWGRVRIESARVTQVAQGILIEKGTASATGAVDIVAPRIYAIPGQHGIYCQSGNVTMTGVAAEDCELDGIKVQTGLSAVEDLTNVEIAGANLLNCRGNAFEVSGQDETYAIRNVRLEGMAMTNDRMLSVTGYVEGLTANIRGGGSGGHGVFIGELASPTRTPKDIDVTVEGRTIGQHGVYVSTNASTNIRVRPNLIDCGQDTADTWDGVNVEGDTTGVAILDPSLVNVNGSMRYGIFQSDAVGRTVVSGVATITGAATDAIRGVGQLAWEPVTNTRAVSATTTVTYADGTILVDATGAARTVNLLPAAYVVDREYVVKKVDASVNAVTVDPSGGETIDGAGTYPLALQYQSVTFQSDGTTWWIL